MMTGAATTNSEKHDVDRTLDGSAACKPTTETPPLCGVAEPERSNANLLGEARKLLDDARFALDENLPTAMRTIAQLAALLDAQKLPEYGAAGYRRGGLAPFQKRKVQNYIDTRLKERLSVNELAQVLSLSTSHFTRAFKKSFGETPHAYIMKGRIAHAKSLMLSTPENLSSIAIRCGLADQAHLCRCFRQATGMSPGEWRRARTVSQ